MVNCSGCSAVTRTKSQTKIKIRNAVFTEQHSINKK